MTGVRVVTFLPHHKTSSIAELRTHGVVVAFMPGLYLVGGIVGLLLFEMCVIVGTVRLSTSCCFSVYYFFFLLLSER